MRGKGATAAAINKLETVSFSEDNGSGPNDDGDGEGGEGEGHADNAKCCAICLSDFEGGDKLRVMPCSHRFHKDCVDEWLKVNASCPSCRCDISGAAPAPEGSTPAPAPAPAHGPPPPHQSLPAVSISSQTEAGAGTEASAGAADSI